MKGCGGRTRRRCWRRRPRRRPPCRRRRRSPACSGAGPRPCCPGRPARCWAGCASCCRSRPGPRSRRPTRRRSTRPWPTGWPGPGRPGCRWAPRASTTGSWPPSAGSTTPAGWRARWRPCGRPGCRPSTSTSSTAGRRGRRLLVGHPGGGGRLAPEHLSAYALTIEPATKFGRLVAAGRMAEPAEDDLADRYEVACATLAWPPATPTTRCPTGPGRPRQPPQPHLLAAGRYLGLGRGRTSSTGPSGAGTSTGCRPAEGPGAPAAHRRGGAPRPRAGAVRGAGAAAADGRRARPGRGPRPGRRPGRSRSRELRGPACWPPGRDCG